MIASKPVAGGEVIRRLSTTLGNQPGKGERGIGVLLQV